MHDTNSRVIIGHGILFLPQHISYKILLPKHLITKQFQLCLLVVVNRDKNHAVIAQQVFGQQQTRVHKTEPAAVGAGTVDVFDVVDVVFAVAQLLQYLALLGTEVVAVNKSVALRVVGRVNVNQLDLAKVAVA